MPLPDRLCAGPFTTAEALRAGVGRGVIDGPSVRPLLQGVHLASDAPVVLATLVAAARLVVPLDAVLTGPTALRWSGIAVGALHPLVFVSRHPHQVRRRGVQVTRVQALPPSRDGVASPVSAFLAAAHTLDLVELVVAGDHLVRTGRAGIEELVAGAGGFRGRGARAARRAAALVSGGVDSPRESELRLCLALAGLPDFEPNVMVGGLDAPIGRFDLVHRQLRVALEYEGDQHRTDAAQWNRDIVRHEQAAAEGWRIVRITAARFARPRSVVALTLQSLRGAGYGGPDPAFSAEWRALFSASARELRLKHAFESTSCAVDRPTQG